MSTMYCLVYVSCEITDCRIGVQGWSHFLGKTEHIIIYYNLTMCLFQHNCLWNWLHTQWPNRVCGSVRTRKWHRGLWQTDICVKLCTLYLYLGSTTKIEAGLGSYTSEMKVHAWYNRNSEYGHRTTFDLGHIDFHSTSTYMLWRASGASKLHLWNLLINAPSRNRHAHAGCMPYVCQLMYIRLHSLYIIPMIYIEGVLRSQVL